MLQSTGYEVVLHDIQEMLSKRQFVSHKSSVSSMVLMVKKCQEMHKIHLFYNKKLFTYVSVDMECYNIERKLYHIDLRYEVHIYC